MEKNSKTPETEVEKKDSPITPDQKDSDTTPPAEPAIIEEIVIEEVGIDGMCGVY